MASAALGARRVLEADQAEQLQVALDLVGETGAGLDARVLVRARARRRRAPAARASASASSCRRGCRRRHRQRGRTASGAPFTNRRRRRRTTSVGGAGRTGTAARSGRASASASTSTPRRRANASSAASIGSPTAIQRPPARVLPDDAPVGAAHGRQRDLDECGWIAGSACTIAGRLVARPRRSSPCPVGVQTSTTAISLRVSVPVLSVQMKVVEPSVSTDSRRRTRALRAAIRWAPTRQGQGDRRQQALGDERDGHADGEEEAVAQAAGRARGRCRRRRRRHRWRCPPRSERRRGARGRAGSPGADRPG